jgi:long-chain fatty acid transport protein
LARNKVETRIILPRTIIFINMAAAMKHYHQFFALCALASSVPTVVHGLGLRVPDQNPAATARGNAFVATADNPSAIYYNPAGITALDGHQFSLGGYGIWLESHYTAADGSSTDSDNGLQAVPQFYYTFKPEKWPVAFGLGFYSPYGLGMEWPENSSFRTLSIEGRISYFTLNPVVAWQIIPCLSVAMGPTLNYSDLDLSQGILVSGDRFRFEGDATDPGFNAGLMWRFHKKHSLGINYRSATAMDYDGQTHTRLVLPAPLYASEAASARFQYPQHVAAGWSFRPSPSWNLEFNADWTDWDCLDTVILKKNSGSVISPYHWQSSMFYEWGATYYFGRNYAVSAGYIFSENSVPDKYFNPLVPDSDRHIFSVGLGHQGDKWSWDAAYQLAYGPTREVGSSYSASIVNQTADGQYEYLSHAITISIGYRF